MLPYISAKPTLHFEDLFIRRNGKAVTFPLNREKCYYFFSARYALAAGIKALGIGPDNTVLLPSYNCGTEIDPFLHLGVKPVFYRVNKDLVIDFDDLLKKISNKVRAILVTHFIGFYQPMDEIVKTCAQRNLFLIEDCAHALLSRNGEKYLGSYGDVSIFSLLKTLPIPNGGALVINNENIKFKHDLEKPKLFPTIFYVAELLKYRTRSTDHLIKENLIGFLCNASYASLSSLRLILAGFRKYVNPQGLYLVKPDSYLFIENLCSWGISNLSRNIIRQADFERIRNIRRRNFEYLLNHFVKNERSVLLFKKLPPGACPLFFPIVIESAEQREMLYRTLKRRGIITHPWWDRFHPAVPWDEFPDAVYLKTRLFGIPVHQDLTAKHLNLVIEEFENAYKSLEK